MYYEGILDGARIFKLPLVVYFKTKTYSVHIRLIHICIGIQLTTLKKYFPFRKGQTGTSLDRSLVGVTADQC